MYLTALLCSVVLLLCNAKDPTDLLNVKEIAEFKVSFSWFAGKEDGNFTIQGLKTIMQWLDEKITEAYDLEDMMEAGGGSGNDDNDRTIDFFKFLDMKAKQQFIDEQFAENEKVFSQFDENQDGAITTQELRKIRQRLVIGNDIQATMEAAHGGGSGDDDNDRRIDFSKFLEKKALSQKDEHDEQIAEYKEVFSWFAGKEDGNITTQELKTIMQRLDKGATDIQAMMEPAYVDGGGDYDNNRTIDICKFLDKKVLLQKADLLNVKEIAEFKVSFSWFAGKEDGNFTIQGLKTIIQWLDEKITEAADLEAMMEAAAFPGGYDDGTIDFPKFKNTKAMRIFFDEIDTDRNDVINATELLYGLNKLGDNLEEKDVKEIVKIKGDGNGCLPFLKFWRMMIWRKRFHEIDTDGKGFLNATNLKNFMNNLGHNMTNEDVIEIIGATRPNSKDKYTLNFPEFLKLMMLHTIFQAIDTDKTGKISAMDMKKRYPFVTDENVKDNWPFEYVVKVNFKTFFVGAMKKMYAKTHEDEAEKHEVEAPKSE